MDLKSFLENYTFNKWNVDPIGDILTEVYNVDPGFVSFPLASAQFDDLFHAYVEGVQWAAAGQPACVVGYTCAITVPDQPGRLNMLDKKREMLRFRNEMLFLVVHARILREGTMDYQPDYTYVGVYPDDEPDSWVAIIPTSSKEIPDRQLGGNAVYPSFRLVPWSSATMEDLSNYAWKEKANSWLEYDMTNFVWKEVDEPVINFVPIWDPAEYRGKVLQDVLLPLTPVAVINDSHGFVARFIDRQLSKAVTAVRNFVAEFGMTFRNLTKVGPLYRNGWFRPGAPKIRW